MNTSNSTPRLRHKVVDVTSVEHAMAVIRGMRSTFHAQQNYQRSACRDDQIMANIEEFDHLVVKKAFEVQEGNRIDGLMNTIPLPKTQIEDPKKKQMKVDQIEPIENEDLSSDDEEEFDRKIHFGLTDQEFNSPPDSESTMYMEGGKAHYAPPQNQTKSTANTQTRKPQKKISPKQNDDSSDDEFLKKLAENDDDDDMAELFKGFVGPKKTQSNQSNKSHLKNYTTRAMAEINSSDEESESLLLSSTQRMIRSAGDDSPTSHNLKPKRSSNLSTTSSSIRTSSASDSREINLPSAAFKKSATLSGTTTSTPKSQDKPPAKHHVMVIPGQRIRVRPSRKQKSHEGNPI